MKGVSNLKEKNLSLKNKVLSLESDIKDIEEKINNIDYDYKSIEDKLYIVNRKKIDIQEHLNIKKNNLSILREKLDEYIKTIDCEKIKFCDLDLTNFITNHINK